MALHIVLNRGIEELLVSGVYFVVVFRVHHIKIPNPLLFVKHCVWVVHLRVARETRRIVKIRIFELLRMVESVFSESGGLIEVLLPISPRVIP